MKNEKILKIKTEQQRWYAPHRCNSKIKLNKQKGIDMHPTLDGYDYNIENLTKINNLIDTMVSNYSKLLVIRLDFGVKKEYQQSVSNTFMTDALTQLRNNMRSNKLFEHFVGYGWKLEWGEEKGWHLHMLLFYNGQMVMNDTFLSMEIAGYWNRVITRDMGTCFSCNMKQGDYKNNGIGMVDYHDVEKIFKLKKASSYLAKNDGQTIAQFDAGGKQYRSFGMSQAKTRGGTVGRPRLYCEAM